MCLAVPARVIALVEGDRADVEVGGTCNRISLALVDDVEVGDYVIVHTGFALTRLDVEEAERTLALFAQIAEEIGEPTDALHPRVS